MKNEGRYKGMNRKVLPGKHKSPSPPPPLESVLHTVSSLSQVPHNSTIQSPFSHPIESVKGVVSVILYIQKSLKVTQGGRAALVCQGYISTIMIHNNINAMVLVFIVTYKIKYNIVNMCLYAIYILVLLTYKFIECNKMYTICCLFS